MDLSFKKVGKFSAFVLAFACSVLITGCGGGGGGTGGNSPVNPYSPPSVMGNFVIDGYVSQTKIPGSVRGNIAASLAQPLKNAGVTVKFIDEFGTERDLQSGATDDKGYYQISFSTVRTTMKNLIIRALLPDGTIQECVVPKLKDGLVTRAPTIDPTTAIQSRLLRKAAEKMKHQDFNVGEVLAVVSQDILEKLGQDSAKLGDVVTRFIAQTEVKNLEFGEAASTLKEFAFELQQRINEAVERGDVSREEAWTVFQNEMNEKARALGISREKLQVVEDFNTIYIVSPIIEDGGPNSPGGEFENLTLERLRSRKIQLLEMMDNAMKILVKEKAGTDFADFFVLTGKIRDSLALARTIGEIRDFFKNNGSTMLAMNDAFARALLEVKFTPNLVSKVMGLEIQPIGIGFSSTGTSKGTEVMTQTATDVNSRGTFTTTQTGTTVSPDGTTVSLDYPMGDPAGIALGYVNNQEARISDLLTRVQKVAIEAGLSIGYEEAKAIAIILWSRAQENLDVPDDSTTIPADPQNPCETTMFGKVESLEKFQTLPESDLEFTHALKTRVCCTRTMVLGENPSDVTDFFETVAWLAQAGSFPLEKVDAAGNVTKTQTTLEELGKGGYDFLEVEGIIVQSSWICRTDPSTPASPVPVSVTEGSASEGNSENITSAGAPRCISNPAYLLVKRVRIQKSPEPLPLPPLEFTSAKGRVVFANVKGETIPGLYFFTTAVDSRLDNAILKAKEYDLDSPTRVRFEEWVDKDVVLSGILFPEFEGVKTIQVTEIRAADEVKTVEAH